MEFFIICIVAFLASGLTFFSGFGLGTILLPAFAIFFPIETAIGMTAVVHFLNNIFKLMLTVRDANRRVVINFGIPSMFAAVGGAMLLTYMALASPLFTYQVAEHTFEILPVKLIVATLMIIFSVIEFIPGLSQLNFGKRYMFAGGLFSGFFGGLSGHQGALRSMFLIRSGLTKESFIASGIVIACMVDVSRLIVYGNSSLGITKDDFPIILAGVVSAFAGAYLGSKLVKKVTLKSLQTIVAIALIAFAIALGAGIL